jgi:hypothetical protein
MLIVALLLAVVASAGCASRQADLTVLSTRNVDLAKVAAARSSQNPMPATGRDVQHWFLIFPLGSRPDLEDAIDDAMNKANGDCMVDAVIYRGWWTVLIYTQRNWEVTGRVLNTYGITVDE